MSYTPQATITMVVIKNDERTGRFRDRCHNIEAYTRVNHVPQARGPSSPILDAPLSMGISDAACPNPKTQGHRVSCRCLCLEALL